MGRKTSIVLLLLSAMLVACIGWQYLSHQREMMKVEYANFILISKQDMTLRLIDYKGKELLSVPVAIGQNAGNKQKQGDMKTPEGVFRVADIQDAHLWKHDFKDGKGAIEGAYGPYFIRLDVPGHKGIGIHGTHLPESLGTRSSEGCIRLANEDIERLVSLIYPPLIVVITPAAEDEFIQSACPPSRRNGGIPLSKE